MTASKGKIVMLANAGHRPSDTRIFQKEAKTLQAAGYHVVIIIPHAMSYSQEGIEIIGVPPHTKGWGKLLVNPWNIFRRALRQPGNSIIHIHDSELLGIGLLLKIFGRRVIYDAHEDTPQQISYQHWIPTLFRKPYAWLYYVLEKISGWYFDAIIIAEPVIGQYFPPIKTLLVRNFPLVASFANFPSVALPARDKKLIYAGLLSKVRGVVEMMKGARLAGERTPFHFILCGQFAPRSLEREVLPIYAVEFLSWVPYDHLVPLLFSARVGIIIPHPIERYRTNYPVKLFEYMAAGLPVIASNVGEASAFVKEADCGILVDPLNVNEISNAIVELMTNDLLAESMGKQGQQLIYEKWNWESEGKRLVEFYNKLFERISK